MKILAINYAKDVEEAIRFYQALGLDLNQDIDPVWTEMTSDGGILAVHSSANFSVRKSGLEVCMVAERPLEEVREGLIAAGFDGGLIVDEDFGRSLRVTDPEGNDLQINDR